MSEKDFDLVEKMQRVEALTHRYQAYSMRAFGPQGTPHRGQGRVLALLKLQSPISQKELSYLMDMRQQSLSELLAKLEQKGFITRTPSEEDRRTTIIALTDAGRQTAAQADEKEMDMGRAFACLSPEEQANLSSYLDRIAQALEKEMDDLGVDWKRFGGKGHGCGGHGHGHGPGHHHGPKPHHGPMAAHGPGCGCGHGHGFNEPHGCRRRPEAAGSGE